MPELDRTLGFRFSYVTQDPKSEKARGLLEVINNTDVEKGFEILATFPVILQYYEAIAKANDLPIDHPLVAEAYWLGSSLLNRAMDISKIHRFMQEKFSQFSSMPEPEQKPLHHNFHVRNYGIASKPNTTQEELDSCLVTPTYIFTREGYAQSLKSLENVDLTNPFNFPLKSNSLVAVHKDAVCARIDNSIKERLLRYCFS